ncbi:HNH endonuclease [Mycobacterium sp. TY813]|uniref:HNH endonuclease n=1 Tax=Mycobacterium TaxID=1763 RepID=UPI0027424D23|nr:HNH endonuclease [Mycobacterium sp. TY813]MDP7729539.1 HNH endonuclease [Mycobacterium sp. TY813]
MHHLVLEAFVGPRPPGLEGCHGNGDPADNSVANLRWDTRSANVFDSVRHGTHNHASRTHCSKGHELTPDNVYKDPARNRRQCKQCARNRARSNRQEKISA